MTAASVALCAQSVVQVFLNETMLDQVGLKDDFTNDFDISPSKLITLVAGNQLHLLGWGGLAPTAKRLPGHISSFAYTSDGLLFVISSDNLGFVNKEGSFEQVFKLPSSGMKISGGKDRMYLYEQNPSGTNSLYAYFKGRKCVKLVESPEPIRSVSEMSNTIYYATGKAIFRFELGKKLQMALGAPGKDVIESVAADPETGALYFSAGGSVYSLTDETVTTVTRQTGGLLKYRTGTLFIFNATNRFLVGISSTEGRRNVSPKRLGSRLDMRH